MTARSTYTPWFPPPGSYIRHFDFATKLYRYTRLLWRRDPLRYPYRFPAVAAAAGGTGKDFDELNPSIDKKHIYLAYLGVCPGFLFCLWHPYDIKNLKWDESIEDINEDLTACIDYALSPYEFPTKALAIEHDRYPNIEPKRNISGETKNPEIIFIASQYVVQHQEELSQEELTALQSGRQPSFPWDFGGEL